MVNKPHNKAKKSYESSSLSAPIVIGAVLILVGVLSLLSLLAGVDVALFGAVKPVLNGIAGCFSFGLAILLIWCGVLLALSASRKITFWALLKATGLYLLMLGLLNLLSRIGEHGFFIDYCIAVRQQSQDAKTLGSVMQVAYEFCSRAGEPAGALGMLVAYPLYSVMGTAFSAIVVIALMLVLILWLFHFKVAEGVNTVKTAVSSFRAKRAARRAEQEQQQLLWEQELEQDPQQSGFRRSAGIRKEQAAAQAVFAAAQHSQQAQQDAGQTRQSGALCPAPSPDLQLYDEVIDTGADAQPEAGKPAAKQEPTPLERAEMQQQRKTIDRFEEIRKRKAELTNRFAGAGKSTARIPETESAAMEKPVETAAGVEEASATVMDKPEPTLVMDEPVLPPEEVPQLETQETYHPLVEDDSDDELEDAIPKMPESVMMHTPMFAPLMSMTRKEAAQADIDVTVSEAEDEPEPPMPYRTPPVELLNLEQYKVLDTQEADQENAAKLVETLSSFGIPAKVQHITHGPAITRFAMGLTASGINVKRIQNIAENIALDLAANGAIRIESQIPGTNLFGIEVPNKEVQTVTFAQVLLSPEMQAATSPLAVGLGHDITGKPVICDLSKMPHLLIAGQTGSGKSVCVNTIINSLLFRASPEEVRMIMIDPKVVELQCYNVVPHLLIPVVSDPHKAAGALAWAVAEMEDRYNKMHTKNVRELSAYNAKLGPDEPKLPRIVIIIDELADLMMASKHDVEESIIRLAQKARAAGIHMVVATQRPTVDVITGLIKSNVPSRIAFAVSSIVDSRTILDKVGAEKLLGRGDMLYMPTGKTPVRVQGCFLSDEEIERIVDYIGEYSRVEFDPDVMEALDRQDDDGSDVLDDGGSESGVDDRLQEAIEMVVTDGQASISMLQRRMKVGYARAGRLIDDMAARGIVSKSLGSKPREVLITREEYERIKDALFDM